MEKKARLIQSVLFDFETPHSNKNATGYARITRLNLISMRPTKQLLTVYSLLEESCFCWDEICDSYKRRKKIVVVFVRCWSTKNQSEIFEPRGRLSANLEVWFGKNVEAKVEFLAFVGK